MNDPDPIRDAGLCASCLNAERTGNVRGSSFILCALSRSDKDFPRYPRLPVHRCRGYAPRTAGETTPAPEAPHDP